MERMVSMRNPTCAFSIMAGSTFADVQTEDIQSTIRLDLQRGILQPSPAIYHSNYSVLGTNRDLSCESALACLTYQLLEGHVEKPADKEAPAAYIQQCKK